MCKNYLAHHTEAEVHLPRIPNLTEDDCSLNHTGSICTGVIFNRRCRAHGASHRSRTTKTSMLTSVWKNHASFRIRKSTPRRPSLRLRCTNSRDERDCTAERRRANGSRYGPSYFRTKRNQHHRVRPHSSCISFPFVWLPNKGPVHVLDSCCRYLQAKLQWAELVYASR